MAKEVICLETRRIYSTIKSAADSVKVDCATISNACNGKNKSSAGYHWLFYSDYKNKTEEELCEILNEKVLKFHQKPVICLNTGKIYESIKKAADDNGVDFQSISACCHGRRKSAGKDKNGNKMIYKFCEECVADMK